MTSLTALTRLKLRAWRCWENLGALQGLPLLELVVRKYEDWQTIISPDALPGLTRLEMSGLINSNRGSTGAKVFSSITDEERSRRRTMMHQRFARGLIDFPQLRQVKLDQCVFNYVEIWLRSMKLASLSVQLFWMADSQTLVLEAIQKANTSAVSNVKGTRILANGCQGCAWAFVTSCFRILSQSFCLQSHSYRTSSSTLVRPFVKEEDLANK